MSGAAKRLHVITWGCQMNVYDSGRMADVLAPVGYAPTEMPEGADMVILNTCHIREKATEKVFSDIGRLRKHAAAADHRHLQARDAAGDNEVAGAGQGRDLAEAGPDHETGHRRSR